VTFVGEALQGNLRFFNGSAGPEVLKSEPTLESEDWAVFFFVLHIDPRGTQHGVVPTSLNFTVELSDGLSFSFVEAVNYTAFVVSSPVRPIGAKMMKLGTILAPIAFC
jgi:hypothetical protein